GSNTHLRRKGLRLCRKIRKMCCSPYPARLVETSRCHFLRHFPFLILPVVGILLNAAADQSAGSGKNAIFGCGGGRAGRARALDWKRIPKKDRERMQPVV